MLKHPQPGYAFVSDQDERPVPPAAEIPHPIERDQEGRRRDRGNRLVDCGDGIARQFGVIANSVQRDMKAPIWARPARQLMLA